MSIELPVAQRGEAVLTIVASPVNDVEFASDWLKTLTENLYMTMLAKNGVGIAAPQVYVSKRIIIVASRPNSRYPNAPEMDPIIMVNPEIVSSSEAQVWGEEGCLSVQNERKQIQRAQDIVVKYQNLAGQEVELELSGFPARIAQHEIDHLNGVLFVDRA